MDYWTSGVLTDGLDVVCLFHWKISDDFILNTDKLWRIYAKHLKHFFNGKTYFLDVEYPLCRIRSSSSLSFWFCLKTSFWLTFLIFLTSPCSTDLRIRERLLSDDNVFLSSWSDDRCTSPSAATDGSLAIVTKGERTFRVKRFFRRWETLFPLSLTFPALPTLCWPDRWELLLDDPPDDWFMKNKRLPNPDINCSNGILIIITNEF